MVIHRTILRLSRRLITSLVTPNRKDFTSSNSFYHLKLRDLEAMAGSLFQSFLVAALAMSPVAQAIRFTYPKPAEIAYAVNLSFLKGDTVNVTWDSVPSDPAKFSLYLWEFNNYPPAYELVAYQVETKAGKASFTVPCNIEPSSNWQLYEHTFLSSLVIAQESIPDLSLARYLLIMSLRATEP